MKVDVAVIPCAGAGTRMLPATRVTPKPMVTVVDRPVIQYVVEEAAACGVAEVVLVIDERPGNPILSHFTQGVPIEGLEGVSFTAVMQDHPKGLGDAVLRAADAVGRRPFVCLLGDNMFPNPANSFTASLVASFDGRAVVAVREIEGDLFDRYGVVEIGRPEGESLVSVTGAVEKPGAEQAPSSLGLVGRYVFPPGIFDALGGLGAGYGGEIQLTDAIDRLAREAGALGQIVDDSLLDVGIPLGLAQATTAVGLSRPDLAVSYRDYLERILGGTK
jgi:UTP--glucose-1-phosphate uridylyltransferase